MVTLEVSCYEGVKISLLVLSYPDILGVICRLNSNAPAFESTYLSSFLDISISIFSRQNNYDLPLDWVEVFY